jgi:hypothetical protein
MGIITDQVLNAGGFAEPQREFFEVHRAKALLKSKATTAGVKEIE